MHVLPLNKSYCGRFAPSPTGPLHFGSLVAALGSCLEARSRGGSWKLRLEDVDGPRCQLEAADAIQHALATFGFEWDGEVMVQSRRIAAYQSAFDRLRAFDRVFACACTRREMADSSLPVAVDGARIYGGICRNGLPPDKVARAWRLRVDEGELIFLDAVQGPISQDLAREVGDFILLRADGQFAYQLAVVVDDADQGVTHVVRGADLLGSTARQILLQRLLGLPTPSYVHLPVAVNAAGEKLSKQTLAAPLDLQRPLPSLLAALRFLGQAPPGELSGASIEEAWRWAGANWDLARVPRQRVCAVAE